MGTASAGLFLGSAALSTVQDTPGSASLTTSEQQIGLRLQQEEAGGQVLVIEDQAATPLHRLPLDAGKVWQAGSSVLMVRGPSGLGGQGASDPTTFVLRALDTSGAAALEELHSQVAAAAAQRQQDAAQPPADSRHQPAGSQLQQQGGNGAGAGAGKRNDSAGHSHFDVKTDKGSADLYFHYYGCLQHQQNMLQDYIRTGTYYASILENPADFRGKAVMDVGCGSGILSLFAAQAGARVVYAVEASDMAHHARQLAAANPALGQRIRVLHGKVEEVEVPEQVDVLVSEPMGTLLVNERMIESYLYARDKHLKPGGKMFPRLGRVHLCAFSDEALYGEVAQKAAFFQSPDFYGVDLSALHAPANAGYFGQVVVDQIPPNVLVSNCVTHTLDFLAITEQELHEIVIPLSLQVAVPCTVHGVASWFDVLFDGSQTQRWLSTAPGLPITHWFQLRCLLEQPVIVAQPGATVSGELRLVAHNRQSYDVHVALRAPPLTPGGPPQESRGKFDLKEPYYRQQMQWMMQMAAPADGGGAAAAAAQQQAQPAVVQGAPVQQPLREGG